MALIRTHSAAIASIVEQVVPSSRIVVRGTGSQSTTLPQPLTESTMVAVPSGIVRVDAGEMTVECFAGTPVVELQEALARVGQRVNLPDAGSVGGNLATAHSSIHRLGRGAVRDAVLRLDVVGADGVAYRCGGDTVKNVSGFDLCRLHVGAFGTLGVVVTVLLRTFPLPRAAVWLRTDHDSASDLVMRQWGITSALSNGSGAYLHCEGHPRDLSHLAAKFRCEEVDAPPALGAYRWSLTPRELMTRLGKGAGEDFGEIGVGVLHCGTPRPPRDVDDRVRQLNERVRAQYDPSLKLNPHIDPLKVAR